MIKQKSLYIGKCDGQNCGEFLRDLLGNVIFEEKAIEIVAALSFYKWQRKGKKCFCPNCKESK